MLWGEEPGLQENNHMGSTSFHATYALTGPCEKLCGMMYRYCKAMGEGFHQEDRLLRKAVEKTKKG
ncbi:hypothetical protein YC2023_057779 [Brassica napus]